MEEIKVNEYVRTKEGYIARSIHYGINKGINGKSCLFDAPIRDISCLVYEEDNFLFDSELKKYIVKHSPNIIDIIECGDYVNGKEILEIKQNAESGLRYLMYSYVPMKYYVERSDEIKSIVTKEQFNQMKYIVGE